MAEELWVFLGHVMEVWAISELNPGVVGRGWLHHPCNHYGNFAEHTDPVELQHNDGSKTPAISLQSGSPKISCIVRIIMHKYSVLCINSPHNHC